MPVLFFLLIAALGMPQMCLAAPVLFSQPGYQSPVTGRPDELLLLPGDGLDVNGTAIYVALPEGVAPETPPASWPDEPTGKVGRLEIVAASSSANALTVRMPSVIQRTQTYALWLRNSRGEWSNAVVINDARPQWFSPASVHATTPTAGLERYLKIVGRNLLLEDAVSARVRLRGERTYEMDARAQLLRGEYVLRAELPARLDPGSYGVSLSRDGKQWVPMKGQFLVVLPDRPQLPYRTLGDADLGRCQPDDPLDDSACLRRGLMKLQATGGELRVPAGLWLLDANAVVVLPKGVSLRGMDPAASRIERSVLATGGAPKAAIVLTGSNRVLNLGFADQRRFEPNENVGPFLQLGEDIAETAANPQAVVDVTISGNRFERTFVAIGGSGAPVRRLIVTHNVFGAFRSGIELTGNRFAVGRHFQLEDLVVTGNEFMPGSRLFLPEQSASVASQLGAGLRVDFSDNLIDGESTRFLYSAQDARGWRAGLFFHLQGNQEQVLVSNNDLRCTGDKIGDGEALAFDNNANSFGFNSAAKVVAASRNSVTVHGELLKRQENRDLPGPDYYVGHWIQVGKGAGTGQVRRISAVHRGARAGDIQLDVVPAWDVLPLAGKGRVSVGREFWQLTVLENTVDQRAPPCQKANRTTPKGGSIALWAQAADSLIAGNIQRDTDGILMQQMHSVRDGDCPDCVSQTHHLTAIEIRENQILGEYDSDSDCSSSGIMGSMGASPTPKSPPVIVSFGINLSRNELHAADETGGGAIVFEPTWYKGPPALDGPLVAHVFVQHNSITGMDGSPARACRGRRVMPRTAIRIEAAQLMEDVVLYRNRCPGARNELAQSKVDINLICPKETPPGCGCPR